MSLEREVILDYEHRFWRSVGRAMEFVEENTGDECQFVLSGKMLTKREALTKLATFTPWDDVKFTDVHYRTYGEGVVALLYHVRAVGDGVQFEGAVSSIYIDRRRRPVLVLHQHSEPRAALATA